MIISSLRSCYREKRGLGVSEVGHICPQGIRTCTSTTCGCTYIRPYQSHPSPAYQGSNHSLHVLKLHGVVSRHSGCSGETSAARIIFSFFNWNAPVTPAWPLAHPGLRTSSIRPKQLLRSLLLVDCSTTQTSRVQPIVLFRGNKFELLLFAILFASEYVSVCQSGAACASHRLHIWF